MRVKAKLAGRKEALRANRRAGGSGVLGPMGQTQDVMSRLYAEVRTREGEEERGKGYPSGP